MAERNTYVADFSLALINRTGAYHICNDLVRDLAPYFDQVRYWRLPFQPQPTLLRKVVGRAMLAELATLKDCATLARAHPRQPVLYMDPLYVLRTELRPEDIVLCHDVGPITHPDLFEPDVVRLYRLAYDKMARVKPGVVVVSDFTGSEFRRLYGEPRFLTTCRLYARPAIAANDTAPVQGVEGPFLLTVGALEKRKNYLRVIEAYRRSGLYEKGVHYVFCGARTHFAPEILKAARNTPGVHPLGYVSEQQLRWLFQAASGFVLVSLLEGFGLPALEAAQLGLASIVSAGTVQEEVMGGAALLADPHNIESIAASMVKLHALSPDEKNELIARGRAQAASIPYSRYIAGFEKILAANAAPTEPI
ncbi:MAG: glycosyltransferase family 1 protein [Hyphomonadaceae bacterium]|nr:glycosyltransferase family 1 protein [Hyphomonadaceae bacterium]